MLEELFQRMDGAYSKNTIRAYKQDFQHFVIWCQAKQIVPLASPVDNFADFVVQESQQYQAVTVERRISSLRSLFTLLGLVDITKHIEIKLAMKRLYRTKGRNQQQAIPLTRPILQKLIAVCSDDLTGMRDRVLLSLGYETMRRRSELCAFTFADLCDLPGDRCALNLRFSKTDQYGQGRLVAISAELRLLINEWQAKVGGDSYILRGVRGNQVTHSFAPASVNRILRKLQDKAKLDLPAFLSGHSFRVGAAVDMMGDGASFGQIMLKGGWKCESMVMRYLRSMVL